VATDTIPVTHARKTRGFTGLTLLAAYIALYAAILCAMSRWGSFDPSNALGIAAVLGVGFSLMAWAVTAGIRPLPYEVVEPAPELILLAVYFVVLTAFVTWGFDWLRHSFPADPAQAFALLIAKLVTFVALPFWIMRGRFGYRWRELAPSGFKPRQLFVMIAMSALFLAFQAVAGRGLRDIKAAHVPANVLFFGMPVAFFWWAIEAGVVEEFFFRVLLQSRLAAWLRSELGGIVVASSLFGLMHAPGLYLRTSITREGLAPHPPLWMAIGYSIVITSAAGFVFGVLWSRTRNFALVVVVHGAADLLPDFLTTMQALHILP
jgi:membrane protease YdiL (CAAX protease family)